MSEKTVFSVKTPNDNEPGDYLLIIQRPGGPFGGGSTTTFWVGRLLYDKDHQFYKAINNGDLIAMFSADTSFLLVRRDRIEQLTREAAMRREYAEEQEVTALRKELYPEPLSDEDPGSLPPETPEAPLHIGQYA